MPKSIRRWRGASFLLTALLSAGVVYATAARAYVYTLPESGDAVVGEVTVVTAREGETLLDIARRYKVGYEEIRLANPKVDTWLPGEGTRVVVPTQYVLPAAPREGIVVNVPEMRLYYYPKPRPGEAARVLTYPISVGRGDWETPLGVTEIVRKDKDPAWRPPASIRAEHAAQGDPLPKVVPPGPANPLGGYALRLGLPEYLIHGTNKPWGIGMKVTHGCMRLYPEDIDALFHSVAVGTQVHLVHQPVKAGWRDGRLFLEVHPSQIDAKPNQPTSLTPLVQAILEATGTTPSDDLVHWETVYTAARVTDGMPVSVSPFTPLSAAGAAQSTPAY